MMTKEEMGAAATDVLRALAKLASEGKSLTISPDWGYGSATLVDDDGAHTHVGADWHEREEDALAAFIEGMHGMLCHGVGLSWVRPG